MRKALSKQQQVSTDIHKRNDKRHENNRKKLGEGKEFSIRRGSTCLIGSGLKVRHGELISAQTSFIQMWKEGSSAELKATKMTLESYCTFLGETALTSFIKLFAKNFTALNIQKK